MNHRNRVQRSWAVMRFVLKKEDIQEMQSQLRDAETGLQTAMMSNSWQLKYIFEAVITRILLIIKQNAFHQYLKFSRFTSYCDRRKFLGRTYRVYLTT